MQLVLSGNRVIAHGENFLAMGGVVINTETGARYENATVAECDGCPSDINEVGYEYHAGAFVPCAPYGKTEKGHLMLSCKECATPKVSDIFSDDLVLLKTLPYAALDGGGTAKCMCYGDGVFVASDGTNMQYSEDGFVWTKTNTAFDPSYIAYGNGVFVALGQTMQTPIQYSTDGKTWYTEGVTAETIAPEAGYIYDITKFTFCGGKFFAIWRDDGINFRKISVSDDGKKWSLSGAFTSNIPCCVAYRNGSFVAACISGTGIAFCFSTDGVSWTYKSSLPSTKLYPGTNQVGLAYIKDRFVCVVQNNRDSVNPVVACFTSETGESWSGESWSGASNVLSRAVNSISFVHNCFVAPCTDDEGNQTFIYSNDGITWAFSALRFGAAVNVVAYGGKKFIIQSGPTLWISRNLNYCTRGGENLVNGEGLPIASTNAIVSNSSLVIKALLGVFE